MSFDFGAYDYMDTSPAKKVSKPSKPKSSFDFGEYETEPTQTQIPKSKYPNPFETQLPEQVKPGSKPKSGILSVFDPRPDSAISTSDRVQLAKDMEREQRFETSRGAAKGFAEGLTFNASHKIPGFEPEESDDSAAKFLGRTYGIAAPFAALATPAGAALGWGAELLGLGKIGQAAAGVGATTFAGGAYEGLRQGIAGEEGDLGDIATEAALAGGTHVGIMGLLKLGSGAIKLGRWIKGLKPEQQANILAEGLIPKDLEPNQYKYFQDEVVPELRQLAESEFKAAQEAAIAENNAAFEQAKQRARIDHDIQVREAGGENAQNQRAYKNQLNQLAAEHQAKFQEIERANAAASQEFQQFDQSYRQQAARDMAVQDALNARSDSSSPSLVNRATPFGRDTGIRPAPAQRNPSLETKAIDTITPNRFTSKTNAGRTQTDVIRSHADIDYQNVNRLYKISEDANSQIFTNRPQLISDLQETIAQINQVPYPSPPQIQLRSAAQALLGRIATIGENGVVTGQIPISNQALLEQAKALRYYMDFEFAQANPKGIFQPTLNAIDAAVETAALAEGDQLAYESQRAARNEYRAWTEKYNNDYVNPFRSRSNHDYISNFEKSLNLDNFPVIERAMNGSQSGRQVVETTRGALVEKHLGKYLKDPHAHTITEFDKALAELDHVLAPEQSRSIRKEFIDTKGNRIQAKPTQKLKEPTSTEPKSINSVKIPPAPAKKVVTEAKIAQKQPPKITEAMKEASKQMKITPEEAVKLTNTPTGIKTLRSRLSKPTFDKAARYKIKDLLYEGAVEKRLMGDEILRVVNKSDNYGIFAEILGEAETKELLEVAKQLAKDRLTVDTAKKYLKPSTYKMIALYGLL